MKEVTKPSPGTCNICNAKIKDVFYDCRIPGIGSWADICPLCFKLHNCTLGMGNGQKYVKRDDETFVKQAPAK